jgi:hypothetical protein
MFLTSLGKILTCMKSYIVKKLFNAYFMRFLTSAPDDVSGHVHALAALPLGKASVTRMELRAGLDAVEKRKISPLPGLELRPLRRPTLS